MHEAFAEAKHVTGGQVGLTCFWVDGPVLAQHITIASKDFLVLRVPDNQLFVGMLTSVELVQVHSLTGSSACITKSDLTQATYLAQDVGRILPSDDVHFVVALVRKAQAFVFSQLLLQHFTRNPCYNLFHTRYRLYTCSLTNFAHSIGVFALSKVSQGIGLPMRTE